MVSNLQVEGLVLEVNQHSRFDSALNLFPSWVGAGSCSGKSECVCVCVYVSVCVCVCVRACVSVCVSV